MAANSTLEVDEIVERTRELVATTTTADAIAYLLSVHKLIEQHPDCSSDLRAVLTMEGALFSFVIMGLDSEAWQDGFALFQEDSVTRDAH